MAEHKVEQQKFVKLEIQQHPEVTQHIVKKFSKESGKKTMVIGHRGGFFGPENSMKTFRAAIENKLEGIEFDVWLSKDHVPMVIHGGDNG